MHAECATSATEAKFVDNKLLQGLGDCVYKCDLDDYHRDEQCGCEIQSLELNVPQGLEAAGCYQHALGSRPVERPEQIAGYVV